MIDSFGIGTQIDCFNMLNIRQRMLKLLFFFSFSDIMEQVAVFLANRT